MENTNAKIIVESGMRFGPYPRDDLFHIEVSKAYAGLGDGFSSVEFVVLKRGHEKQYLYFIEAKSSSPNPENGTERFFQWIYEVAEKFSDSLQLFLAADLGIQPSEEIGRHMRDAELCRCGIKFILVMSQHKKEWLPPIRDALMKHLRKTLRVWNIEIIALNREMAVSYGFVE